MNIKQKFLKQLDSKYKTTSKSEPIKHSMASLDYTIPQIPCLIERKNDPWIWYGENNLYPLQIADLRAGSGIHNSIINLKTKMTAGDGWLINGAKTVEESDALYSSLPINVKADYDLFINNPNNQENIYDVKEKCADDYQTHGAFAYEIIFNTDMNKITRIKYVDVENLRSGKLEADQVKTHWYSRDWREYKKNDYKPIEMFAFDPNDKEHMNQLVYVKKGKNEYYGDIPYKGCLNWIMVDFKMGLFHLSNIDNGMNPGMWFKFYQMPETEEQKQDILKNIVDTYRGAKKTNQFVATFSPNKELAMDIQPVQQSNLDKQLLLLAELSDKKIVTGHQLNSPSLAGVAVSGVWGASTELEMAFKLFDSLNMASDRAKVDRSFQQVLDFNKTPVTIKTNPWNPFKTTV